MPPCPGGAEPSGWLCTRRARSCSSSEEGLHCGPFCLRAAFLLRELRELLTARWLLDVEAGTDDERLEDFDFFPRAWSLVLWLDEIELLWEVLDFFSSWRSSSLERERELGLRVEAPRRLEPGLSGSVGWLPRRLLRVRMGEARCEAARYASLGEATSRLGLSSSIHVGRPFALYWAYRKTLRRRMGFCVLEPGQRGGGWLGSIWQSIFGRL